MVMYLWYYDSPLGRITLASDGCALTGLWFAGQKHAPDLSGAIEKDLAVFRETVRWLDVYFSGGVPDFTPRLHLEGTPFRQAVWARLQQIPYGRTVTYGQLAAEMGLAPVAARAVGGAVGRNPISLIVPCHRVMGANGSLTGYDGGVDKKQYLLELENIPYTRDG